MQHIAGAVVPPARDYDADILILALDRAPETAAAIRSALAQRAITRHVFVIDQGSQPEGLARLAACVADRDDATLVRLDRNHGVAGGRNRGAALGHGRVIAALDNDAEFADAETLARAVAALDAEPDIAALGLRITVFADGSDDLSSWGYPPGLLPRAADTFDAVTFVGAGHAIRRAAWDDAGGYDDALFFCWEEYDFCLRAIALGWQIRYRGDIVVRHKVSAGQRVAWDGDRWFYHVRNRLYIERKLGRTWLSLAPRIAGYLLKGMRNGLSGPTMRGIRAALSMVPDTVRELPAAGHTYCQRNDSAHRGGPGRRLMQDVFSRIAVEPARRRRQDCRSDSVATTGSVRSPA